MTTDPVPPAPGTEPSDEAEVAEVERLAVHLHETVDDHGSACRCWAYARAVLASPWLAAHDQRVAREAVEEALALEPAERLALAVGSAQVERGEAPMDNIAIACVLTLVRLADHLDRIGTHDA